MKTFFCHRLWNKMCSYSSSTLSTAAFLPFFFLFLFFFLFWLRPNLAGLPSAQTQSDFFGLLPSAQGLVDRPPPTVASLPSSQAPGQVAGWPSAQGFFCWGLVRVGSVPSSQTQLGRESSSHLPLASVDPSAQVHSGVDSSSHFSFLFPTTRDTSTNNTDSFNIFLILVV